MSERGSLKVLADPEIFLFFLKISYMFAPEIFSNKRASKLWIGVWKCSVGIFFQSWLQCFLFYIIAKKVYQMWIFAYWLPINYCTRKYKGSQGVAWSNNYSRFVQHVEIVINFSLLETSQWRLISANKKLNWNLQWIYILRLFIFFYKVVSYDTGCLLFGFQVL